VAPAHTAGWIKVAEIEVADSAASITQAEIKDVRDSDTWTTEAIATVRRLVSALMPGYLFGLRLSNGTDADHDIDIAVGRVVDSTYTHMMILHTGITKQLDAAWAVGTDVGGLDTGSVAVDETYHMFLIRKDSDGTIDALFSLSATAPTMPAGYTAKRRIGAVITDGSSDIIAFTQYGDRFRLKTMILDFNSTIGTTAATITTTAPTGIQITATVRGWLVKAAAAPIVIISSLDETDSAPNPAASPLANLWAPTSGTDGFTEIEVDANTAQIRARSDTAATNLRLGCVGWVDRRGQDGGA